MTSLVPQREKYLINFANSMYDEFLKLKYGIASCLKKGEAILNDLRKDIVEYQINDDGGALCEVSIKYMGWLSVYYPDGNGNCEIKRYSSPSSIGLAYVNQSTSTNVIEVTAGGCITKINVNPSITINTGGGAFVYTQNCGNPQTVWHIVHNLGIVPNVWAADCNNNNISGTVAVVNNNEITLTFSTAVAGKAYLS
jgi:hypothetical protein